MMSAMMESLPWGILLNGPCVPWLLLLDANCWAGLNRRHTIAEESLAELQ
jgi:hypothetical protein